MTPEEALSVADQVLYVHAGKRLTDIQRLILLESLAGKGYEEMQGYATQHIKNEGKELWAALSGALDEKVSKTNFRGALEKRLRSTQIVPKPPSLSAYDAETWAGRDALIDDLLNQLHGQTRLLCLTGISGIGKTALAECLAVQFQNLDVSFHRVSFDIVGQSQDFTAGAAEILAELGDKDLDPKELNDPKRLSDRLLRKLQMHQYWLQLDALERLLDPEHPTEFTDSHWLGFFQRCLSSSDFPSRLVLTAQAIPSEFARFEDDYPHAWGEQTLRGLSETEQLELFGKYGVTGDSTGNALLSRIGQTYEGHPLVLRVIGGEIRKDFSGNVVQYWERYGREFDQVARELQSQRVNPALYNQTLQKRVRQRVEISLKRLPEDALALLCRSAVYRRPVVESFWLVMLDDCTSLQQQEAYRVLGDRALIEQEGIHQGQLLARQHNLIRDVAYDILRVDESIWRSAERKAAELWLTKYKPLVSASNLEKVRGQMEALHHFCELADWDKAGELYSQKVKLSNEEFFWQLFVWGYYKELIQISRKLLVGASSKLKIKCLLNLGNSYSRTGDQHKAIEYCKQALVAIREFDERQEESNVLGCLGLAYYNLGDYDQSINYHNQNLTIAHEIGDQLGESNALGNLGVVSDRLGNYEQSINYYTRSLAIARDIGNRLRESNAMGNLGNAYSNLGNYEQAINFYRQTLVIAREIGNRQGESNTLCGLGIAYSNLGNYEQAINFYRQTLVIAREISDQWGEGNALANLGFTYDLLGDHEQAIDYCQQYLAISQKIGDRRGEGIAMVIWGYTLIKLKQYSEALERLQLSLETFREIGDRANEAEALLRLANLHQKTGADAYALEHCNQALVIATEVGIPLAEECRILKEELENGVE